MRLFTGAWEHSWNFGDGGTSAGPEVEHLYTQPGIYTVVLSSVPTVNSGAPDAPIVASLPVYVLPAYTIESAGDDTSPLTVYFAADTLIDDSAFSSGLTWDFGDNQMGTGKTTTHTYAAPGTYNVVLSFVVGTLSFNCSQVQTVVPKATGDKPLVADAGPNQTVTEGDIVALGGTGNNGDGPNVNYEWSQLSGPTVTLNDPGLRHPTFVAPEVTTTSVCEMRLEAFRNSQSRVSTVRITILDDDAVGGELTINGSNNLESTGAPGGPFNPSNIVYTLTNTGGLPIDWLAVGSDTWISLSTAGGTIAPGESSFLGVAVNLTANNFAAGNYSGSVRITNATDGQGGGTRDVNLSIVGPTGGTLAVTPNTDLASSGLVGGPFTPAAIVYTLTNPGTNSIDWAATGTESWTSLSATSGSLASGATTDVTVTINSGATGLSPGNHTDTVSFTNVTNGSGNTTRTVSLAINPPPGALTITPNIPTISSGNAGGPFSTSNNIYTLRNIGGTPIDWTATKTQNWVSVSSASGTLAAGATINLTVSINSSANGLSVGGYNDTVTIRNSTNGVGNSTRGVMLSVNAPPGALAITPSAGLSTSGTVGGPFTPGSQAYTLTNTGGVPINWSASRNQTWTTLSSTNGTLSAGANTTVTVSINSNANALTAGNYSDTVTFTNATNGSGNTSRAVSLMVNPAPGVLAVTPTSGFNSSGTAGGPFSPANKTYTLTNSGGTTLNWSVSKNQSWVTASPASGSLAAGANVVVTVSINSNADSLATGSYSDSVSITNLTNGNGNTTRSVALTVNAAPGALSVTPSSGLTSSGTVGGPFSPASKIYTLTNFGGTSINWTAAKTQSWVTLSSSGGTLAAGANTTVTVSINSNANSLAAGSFSDAVTFTNSTNGTGNTTRPVSLTVNSATPAGPMTAPFSPTSATINGILAAGEWTDANSYSMDAANQVAPGVVIEGTTTTSTDASAVIYVKQDSNFVYVAVDVTDDSVVNSAADVWDADSVELFLDANNSNTVDIGSERLQFDVNAGGGTAATSGVPSGSWNGAGATRSGGYVVEFRLSKSALGLTSSQTYGFDVHVHDVEPSAGTLQTGYWYFSAGPSPESDESQWGNLILSAVSQATLSVTPSTGLMATGLQGGPFSPNSKVFTLTNNGTLSMNWTAAKTQNWVNLSSASGTLAAGANTTVTVSLNANALAAGSFSDTVTFTNTTDGNGNTTRPIALTVTSPVGVLAVAGSGGTTCSGPFGGPFSTTSSPYTLTNTGNATMNWTATPTQNWVTPNPASGSLPAGASTTVNVSVNSNANALAAGSYSDTVTFTNTTNGTGNTTRPVALTVNSTSAQAMSTASRTSGVAPLAVFFDATLPQSGVVQPSENVAGTLNYASQTYVWDFGDPASGNWTRVD
ncbi:MAG: PKD domain-containing protein [Planctomycetes bacterium]|nr:PKD domain-containing protein [Planctomycetota bacterium]